ncbi:hypothetical protein [Arthrobacter sp. 7Tela_A1]|uniref:hypothetical protein n=1 Tax=Arthrobacter sp. 7Tela_A1 TaxID=3093745 RepID=UPI003BB53638
MIDDFILNEYKARQSWDRRDYRGAMLLAKAAADIASSGSDEAGWWRMTFLYGECQLELGDMDGCTETARLLTEHPLSKNDPEFGGKAKALLSLGLQGIGHLPQALAVARDAAVESADIGHGGRGKVEAQQALVAALGVSGNLDDAWSEAQILAEMVREEPGMEKVGKAYWAIGNVAFLKGENREATHYHDLAASKLSPGSDVSLWALFNKASAFMRLTADLVEPETLQCIERAEMALSIAGGTPQDQLDVAMTRAYWTYLTGDISCARQQMEPVLSDAHLMAPHGEAEARFLMARIVADEGDLMEADKQVSASAALFDKAGAAARASQARAFHKQLLVAPGRANDSLADGQRTENGSEFSGNPRSSADN